MVQVVESSIEVDDVSGVGLTSPKLRVRRRLMQLLKRLYGTLWFRLCNQEKAIVKYDNSFNPGI